MAKRKVFLANPANKQFIIGRVERPAPDTVARIQASGCVAMMGLFLAVVLFVLAFKFTQWLQQEQANTDLLPVTATYLRDGYDDEGAYVVYRYEVDEQASFEGRLYGTPYVEDYIEGKTLEVYYLRSNPALSTVPGHPLPNPFSRSVSLLLFVLVGLALPGLFLSLWLWRQNRRMQQLWEGGCLVWGKLLSCEPERGSEGLGITFSYQFTSPESGKTCTKKQNTRKRTDLIDRPMPKPGTMVPVLYLDDRNHHAL